MDNSDYLQRLNPQQVAAVEHTEGPMLVVAGAGSGKTTVLTAKIAYLLSQKGVKPWRVLALTFTNKAAREMRQRIELQVGQTEAAALWMGTFHSIFSRILRQEGHRLGFSASYTIYQPSDTRSLIKAIVRERGLDDKVYKPQLIAERISEAKNMLVTPKLYMANTKAYARDDADRIPLTGEIYADYFNRCHTANAMDFDDLLLFTYIIFDTFAEVRQKYAERFSYILVDEFQDTNYAQMAILRQLAEGHGNICAVGDDAQSIYSFRGARIDNILNFDKVFDGTKVYRLERNYRSTQSIVNAANSLISKNKNQIPKKIFSENEEGAPLMLNKLESDQEEAEMLCNRIKILHDKGVRYSDMAILYRTNIQSDLIEETLGRHGIPSFIFNDLSRTERKEYRDFMAYLRLVVNPIDEEALRRIINFPTRGIGSTTLDKIFACAREGQTSAWNVVQQPDLYGLSVNNGTKARLQGFASMIKNFIAVNEAGADAYQLGQQVMKESGLIAQAQADRSPEGIESQERYLSFLNSMDSFVQRKSEEGEVSISLVDYLSETALITNSDVENDGSEKVNMMTVHVAKGLEFDIVFITGMEQGIFPSVQSMTPKELEEERRLFFVAITRAKKRCYLSCAKTRFRHGKSDWFEPSQFLKDIDPEYIYQESSSRSASRSNLSRYIDFDEDEPLPARWGGRNIQRIPNERGYRSIQRTQSIRNTPRNPSAQSSPTSLPSTRVQNGEITAGSRVEHATFGQGTVERIEDNMTGLKAIVNFDNCGQKTLLLKYAKLIVI